MEGLLIDKAVCSSCNESLICHFGLAVYMATYFVAHSAKMEFDFTTSATATRIKVSFLIRNPRNYRKHSKALSSQAWPW
jgi:hypothetical protein